MKRFHRLALGLLASSLLLSGCYGSFNLTRQVYHWNSQAGEKWPREFLFLILTAVPVYGIASLADAIVFNSIEFWNGTNPVEAPHAGGPRTRRLVRGGDAALLTYTPISPDAELYIEQFQRGRPAGSLRIHRQGALAVGSDAQGRVLMSARTLADGGILIRDGSGKQMASYSTEQVDQLLGDTSPVSDTSR
ncbi:MAG: DUF3332 family protein [Candidatus Omnitrophica bacterium]|nr:DUF3332 family protein [Candidatus Omnitrophota bacterium]